MQQCGVACFYCLFLSLLHLYITFTRVECHHLTSIYIHLNLSPFTHAAHIHNTLVVVAHAWYLNTFIIFLCCFLYFISVHLFFCHLIFLVCFLKASQITI